MDPKLNELPTPMCARFLPVPPAATTTMLPVLCILKTVSDDGLPSTLTDLTLRGPRKPTPLPNSLLIIQSGPQLPTEPALCIWTLGLEFVPLEPTIRMLVTPFRSVDMGPIIGPPVTLLFPTPATEFARLCPPVSLQLTIMALVSTRELLPTRMPTIDRSFIPIVRPITFIQEKLNAPLGAVRTEHWLLTLATMLPEAFRINMAVLTSGLFRVLAMALAIAPLRVDVVISVSRYIARNRPSSSLAPPPGRPRPPPTIPTPQRTNYLALFSNN